MQLSVGELLSRVTTVSDMTRAFQEEEHCRRLLEAMVWPNGRLCPACGYRRSIALMGRGNGKQAQALPMLKWNLPGSVHRHDPHTSPCDQAPASGLALRPLADAAIRQGHLLDPLG